ncbi:cleavage stimulating factor 64-like isoform X2 [Mangifera indica]|uniref:cleavage stimulating factor 64-like isoform X2 n=1 Tax=Mangifera indica TaxID=29780 RepID=UPI001CFB2E4E|nr:cleavage stimulating factor 64-like isoform X2 [Mangifera indica]
MASSQHRCVFVGNIPYDATEEQLIEICREVGPVVSFRLVLDRETGKPKGYGFCEYKDEETALSARRNLHGYEINGRQLRVDFAENDKGADRNREQGRGGPGLAVNFEPQKQIGGPAIHGDAVPLQPIGLHLAITAATVMTGALGGAQVGILSNQNGVQSQVASANDPLTLHLAKMSRSQLNDIMSELKSMATQNKELTRQLLLAKPQLLKALFQAEIMLGMVSPQVLQMPNLLQGPGHLVQTSLLDGLQQAVQLPGLPPLAQKPTMHLQTQLSQHAKNQSLQQAALPGQPGVPTLTSMPSVRPPIQVTNSSSLIQQLQPHLLENPIPVTAADLGNKNWTNIPKSAVRPPLVPRPPSLDAGFQPGTSTSSDIVQTVSKDADRSGRLTNNATWAHSNNAFSSMPMGVAEKTSILNYSSELTQRPSKLMKLDDQSSSAFSVGPLIASKTIGSAPSQAAGVGLAPIYPVPNVEGVKNSENQISQSQLPPDVESALLQQVMSLTPEQLSSLPLEQRQQVIQLQQALLQNQMQPS